MRTLAEPVENADNFEIAEFEIVEDEPERFVVHERRMIRGVEGGADQLYFHGALPSAEWSWSTKGLRRSWT